MTDSILKKNDGLFWAKAFATGISDAVLLLDKKFNTIWWNNIAQKTLLISTDSHLNKPVVQLFNSLSFTNYIEEKQTGTVEFPLPKQPDKMLSIVLIPYGKLFILVAQDISSKNHIDTMRQDFIANVSHEMRTPLTVIQGYLEIVQDEVIDTFPHLEDFINQMQQQMHRLENLLEDLLLLSRIQKGKLKIYDLCIVNVPKIINSAVEDAKNISRGKHKFILNISTDLYLNGQEKELSSCFANLIINAIRYSPEGGDIIISWSKTQNNPCFSVKDFGIGIRTKHIPRLTERFYRVDKGRSQRTGGTGLGLAIVKHVLLRHKATLEITSKISVGSTFTCYFPTKYKRDTLI